MMSGKAPSGERFADTSDYAKAYRGAGEATTEASRSKAASALLIKLACIFMPKFYEVTLDLKS